MGNSFKVSWQLNMYNLPTDTMYRTDRRRQVDFTLYTVSWRRDGITWNHQHQ
jgi:hypothetical protein